MKRELTYADRLRQGFTDAGDAEVLEAFAGRVRGRKRAMAGRRDAQRICGDQASLLINSTLHPPQKKTSPEMSERTRALHKGVPARRHATRK